MSARREIAIGLVIPALFAGIIGLLAATHDHAQIDLPAGREGDGYPRISPLCVELLLGNDYPFDPWQFQLVCPDVELRIAG
ncbi:MAG: hypothetical protein HYU28_09350 [Actinobacteria bacterium]|nr:hypothetical protein [Actinomycetota bacterium]